MYDTRLNFTKLNLDCTRRYAISQLQQYAILYLNRPLQYVNTAHMYCTQIHATFTKRKTISIYINLTRTNLNIHLHYGNKPNKNRHLQNVTELC